MISRRSLLIRAGSLAAIGGAAWLLREKVVWPTPAVAFAAAWSSGWLEVSDDLAIVTVDASVNGMPVRALIDTGAQRSVIDRTFVDRLGLAGKLGVPMVALGVGGAPQLGRSVAVAVRLGEMSLDSLQAAVLDLGALAAVEGERIPLVIGEDVLGQLMLDLDLPNRRLAFRAREDARPAGSVEPLGARRLARALYVPVVVEGHALDVVLDTGSSSALALSADAAKAAGLLDRGRPVRQSPSVTLGGASFDRQVMADSFSFGGQAFGRTPVSIYESKAAAMLPPGLLGVAALRRDRMLIDIGEGKLGRVRKA